MRQAELALPYRIDIDLFLAAESAHMLDRKRLEFGKGPSGGQAEL